jgi:hypothetical protein
MQDTLLNIALYGTASHVERLVREFRRSERLHEAYEAEAKHRERYVRFRYDEDGSMLISARLPPEVGALVERAIEAARAEVEAGEGCNSRSGASAETSEDAVLADPRGARRADALQLLAESFLASGAERCPSAADRYQVVVHIDQRMLCDGVATADASAAADASASVHASAVGAGAAACASASGSAEAVRAIDVPSADNAPLLERGRSELENGPALAVETARRLGCDGTLVGVVENAHGNPLDLGRKTRAISPALKRALKARDGGCRFPGCDRTRFTHAHHVMHWADGGETKLSNLITLCTFHHRLVHEGGFSLRATDDGVFVFSTPDGQRLSERGRIEQRRFRGNILATLNAARGVEPKRAPGWHGERMQYWWAVEAMRFERRVGMR